MSFAYDAFISYSHSDRKWVNDILLTALEAGGVKTYIDERDFELGGASLNNMAEAVGQSQRTVLVLTPKWLASPWANLEAQMVALTDPAGWHGRMVPIRRVTCEPPWWISIRSWADFIDDAVVSERMERLVRLLKRPVSEIVRTDRIRDGIETLSVLVRRGVLRQAALRYVLGLEEVADRTKDVRALKAVHDYLDHLQRHCLDAITRKLDLLPLKAESLDDPTREEFRNYALTLEEIVEALHQSGKEPVFASSGLGFIPKLQLAHDTLIDCHNSGKVTTAREVVSLLSSVLDRQPGRIDLRLSVAAGHAQLGRVIKAITQMCLEARNDPDAGADVAQQLEQARNDLEALDDNVQELVRTHYLWQELDLAFRVIDTNSDVPELRREWEEFKRKVAVLSAAVPSIVRSSDDLGNSVNSALQTSDAKLIISKFRMYKTHAGTRFSALDRNLKHQCEELVSAGVSIADLVGKLAI